MLQDALQKFKPTPPVGNPIHGEETPPTEAEDCHDQRNGAGEATISSPGKDVTAKRIEVVTRHVTVTTGVAFDGESSVNVGQPSSIDPEVALQMLAGNTCTAEYTDKSATITPLTVTLPGTTGFVRAVSETVADAAAMPIAENQGN